MRHTLPAWIERPLSALRPAGARARAATASERPEGVLLWIWDCSDGGARAALVARRVSARLPELQIALTYCTDPSGLTELPPETLCLPAPEDRPASVRLVLDAWRPAMILILGNRLPAALIAEANRRGIALALADAQFGTGVDAISGDRMIKLLARFERIYLRDDSSRSALERRLSSVPIAVSDGALSEPADPLPCSEAERSSMAEAIGARPVWLATSLPRAELDIILGAHRYAMRHAHRLLLVLVPDDSSEGADLARELSAQGWAVACRSQESEPQETTEIFVADDAQEYGLWYRLAPLSYMGGTLSGEAQGPRAPFEPAALGSAVLHGPHLGPARAQYIRLENAHACRGIRSASDLPDALADLIAPDRAAHLAHNAWLVSSGGAGAVETVAGGVAALLEGHIANGRT
ncbi:3-deoxy-D-manno-octulosonic acid transferase [Thioclava sp. BHET1]|nr:3-deoxy-D-manno-octulosonic acid transferase [Thioclava sp. BHET1]